MYRILIVDDEPIERVGLQMMIQRTMPNAFYIFQANNGRIAIEQAEEQRPHLIFMDIQMPGLSGIDAIRYIKKNHSTAKIVILTAFDTFSYAKEAISLGVSEYLLKPVKKETLITLLTKLMKEVDEDLQKKEEFLSLHEKLSAYEEHIAFQEVQSSKGIPKILEYIQVNIKKDLTLEELAEKNHMNATTLSKLFKKEVGMNFVDYLTAKRIEQAKELLLHTECSLKEICFQIGYNNPNYLSRVFKKEIGMTPTEFRLKKY